MGEDATWLQVFLPHTDEPEFHPQVAPPEFVLALAERIYAAHEVLGKRAEKREWTLTECDYPLE
jgi:hypothetical protein